MAKVKAKTSKTKLSNKFKTKKSKGNQRRNATAQRSKTLKRPSTDIREAATKPSAVRTKSVKTQRKEELLSSLSFQRVLSGRDADFLNSDKDVDFEHEQHAEKPRRKRKNSDSEAMYEQMPRSSAEFSNQQSTTTRLLPVKGKHGVIQRHVELEAAEAGEPADDPAASAEDTQSSSAAEHQSVSVIELYASRQKDIEAKTLQIATISQSVIEDPSKKIDEIDAIIKIAKSRQESIVIRRRSLLSLLEIFKDIIPGYRIRPLTDAEQTAKVSKEVSLLRTFEEGLLRYYKEYLEILESLVALTSHKKQEVAGIVSKANFKLSRIAARCFSELLLTKTHFNYRVNIITVLVPSMNLASDYQEIGDLCVETFKTLFRDDLHGQVSLEAVQVITRLTKSKMEHTRAQVIETFLSLRINPDLIKQAKDKETKAERLKRISRERKMLSRKDRKRKKAAVRLEHELKEVEATDDVNEKRRLQTEILKLVFAVYFRVLKTESRTSLLSPTLKGLSKFAQLINVDFFNDLFARLKALVTLQELRLNESLNCVLTAFTILSGQGEAFNLDPHHFYIHLYNALLKFDCESTNEDVDICIRCLDLMLVKRRRQVSPARVLAFVKRIATLAAQLRPEHAVKFLIVLKSVSLAHVKTQSLFDNEVAGRGLFTPELPDPEHCNADCTKLWELCTMQQHFSTAVRRYSLNLATSKSSNPSLGNEGSRVTEEPQSDVSDLVHYIPKHLNDTAKKITANPRDRIWISELLAGEALSAYKNAIGDPFSGLSSRKTLSMHVV